MKNKDEAKHNFIESKYHTTVYDVVIYCTQCGVVVWDWNKNEKTDLKQSDLQLKAGKPCVYIKDLL